MISQFWLAFKLASLPHRGDMNWSLDQAKIEAELISFLKQNVVQKLIEEAHNLGLSLTGE